MVRYGNKVRICDGSPLDGAVGVAYDVKLERVWVLLDREVFWAVAPEQLEVIPQGEQNSGAVRTSYLKTQSQKT